MISAIGYSCILNISTKTAQSVSLRLLLSDEENKLLFLFIVLKPLCSKIHKNGKTLQYG